MRKEALGETYGYGETCEGGCREDGVGEMEVGVRKGGSIRCFPNSSLEFIV